MVNSILATNVVVVLVPLLVEMLHLAVPSKPVVTFAPIISSLEVAMALTELHEIGNLGSSNIMYFVDSIDKVMVVLVAPITIYANKIVAKAVLVTIVERIEVEIPQKVDVERIVSLVNEGFAKDVAVIGSAKQDPVQVVFEIA